MSVGSFGPIDIKPESPTYGYITTTPKAGWANVDLLGKLKGELDIPMVFTTDVNSSAYGEMIVTGGKSLVYFTIGTGIIYCWIFSCRNGSSVCETSSR